MAVKAEYWLELVLNDGLHRDLLGVNFWIPPEEFGVLLAFQNQAHNMLGFSVMKLEGCRRG